MLPPYRLKLLKYPGPRVRHHERRLLGPVSPRPISGEQGGPSLKGYKIENDIVRGSDEDKGDLTDGKYARSVKFVAAISK